MARKNSTSNTQQLNYGIYTSDSNGYAITQVFDGTELARYETIEQAQAALPRLQAAEDAAMLVWGLKPSTLVIGGRTW